MQACRSGCCRDSLRQALKKEPASWQNSSIAVFVSILNNCNIFYDDDAVFFRMAVFDGITFADFPFHPSFGIVLNHDITGVLQFLDLLSDGLRIHRRCAYHIVPFVKLLDDDFL